MYFNNNYNKFIHLYRRVVRHLFMVCFRYVNNYIKLNKFRTKKFFNTHFINGDKLNMPSYGLVDCRHNFWCCYFNSLGFYYQIIHVILDAFLSSLIL